MNANTVIVYASTHHGNTKLKTIFHAIRMFFTFILREIQERIMRIVRRKLQTKETATVWACSIVRDLILLDHLSWLEA